METVESFLNALKRPSVSELVSKFSSWDDLFQAEGKGMKAQGINVKERRYLLWAMEMFRWVFSSAWLPY